MFIRTVKVFRDGLLGITYPAACRLCGDQIEAWDDGVCCGRCWNNSEITKLFTDRPICGKCGEPVRAAGSNLRCGLCESSPLDIARSCGEYSGALEASILFLKASPRVFPRLRGLLAATINQHERELSADLVVPIPLHRLREKERGFNQAAILAKEVARKIHVPIEKNWLTRVKPSRRHRAGMDSIERAKSVQGAFALTGRASPAGKTILLVDDVLTTGSTVSEAANTLLKAGAHSVKALTLARALVAKAPVAQGSDRRRPR